MGYLNLKCGRRRSADLTFSWVVFLASLILPLIYLPLAESVLEENGVSLISKRQALRKSSSNSVEIPVEKLIPANYSVHHPPPTPNGEATQVDFSILVMDIRDIKELNEELSLEMNLRMYWSDTRLKHLAENLSDDEPFRILKPGLIEKIWSPDIFIDHVKAISQATLITKPASLRVYRGGDVRYSTRITVTEACQMRFHYYPADTQRCHFDIKSYAYTDRILKLDWRDGKEAQIVYNLDLHNFDVQLDTTQNFLLPTSSGNYSGIRFAVLLRRKLSYHLIQTYLPSSLFIVVSWLSFLVPPESVPGRMALCMTTLLTLTAMFAAVRQNTPNVSYVKALDIWMVVCIVFVFLALLEYTIVLKLKSKKQKAKDVEKRRLKEERKLAQSTPKLAETVYSNLDKNAAGIGPSNYDTPVDFQAVQMHRRSKEQLDVPSPNKSGGKPPPKAPLQGQEKYEVAVKRIELSTSIIVPLLFVIFNFIYWPWLIIAAQYYSDHRTPSASE